MMKQFIPTIVFLFYCCFCYIQLVASNSTITTICKKRVAKTNLTIDEFNQGESEEIRTFPITLDQVHNLFEIKQNFTFFSEPRLCGPTDILVKRSGSNENKRKLINYLKTFDIEFQIKQHDVDAIVKSQRETDKDTRSKFSWRKFHRWNTIDNYVREMVQDHDDVAKIHEIGDSVEGRKLVVVEISTPGPVGVKRKPAVFLDAGIHAREWASVSTAVYILNQLLSERSKNQVFLKNLDIFILPVVNPDGYHYSRTVDRMWRKNRRKNEDGKVDEEGKPCDGVDLNRNFGTGFNTPGAGVNDPCFEGYRGPNPFSEPESKAIKDFIEKEKRNWQLYLTLHTYGEVILTPYGYKQELPPDYKELEALGLKAADALEKVHGTSFQVGTAAKIMGEAGGGSDDWAKATHFKYSYTLELRDNEEYGFLLPGDMIQSTAEEVWAAFQVFAKHIIDKNKRKTTKKSTKKKQPRDTENKSSS